MPISWYIAIGGIISTIVTGMLFKAQYDANIEMRANMAVLKEANKRQSETINNMLEIQAQNANQLLEESRLREEANIKTAVISSKLNSLRPREAQLALQAPFERGNAANDRRNAALLRFAGTEEDGGGSP